MKISTKIYIAFSLIIFFAIVGTAVDIKLSKEVRKNTEFLTNSEAIIRNSGMIHKSIIEMQSGFRGYLLTGNENFLESYYNGLGVLPKLFKEEKKLIPVSDKQEQKIDSIKLLHEEWVLYSSSLINAKRKTMTANEVSPEYKYLFENKLQKEVGKRINDEIARKFRQFDRYEYSVREKRRAILNASVENTRIISIILSISVVLIGLLSGIYLTQVISRRISSMVALAEKISKGEFHMIRDKENDELTHLTKSLNIMSYTLDKNFSELERKNKELDQFAYVVSHDLKAPLRGLNNVFNWIEEDLDHEISASLKRYHEMMKGRIHRLENLITGLLQYARIGREEKRIEQVQVDQLVKEITDMLVPPHMKVNIKDKLPVVVTEKIRLEQVFSNLISNAVKYAGKEDGKITISCKDEKDCYRFTVADNGIGISPEYHNKIFVIFQTLREKNEKESTGIGLAIVKKILEEQKGEIRVYSELNKGASFVFTWPKNSSISNNTILNEQQNYSFS